MTHDLQPMVARLDGDVLDMARGKWSLRVPASELPKWTAFYRSLHKRAGGRYAAIYDQPLRVLQGLAKN